MCMACEEMDLFYAYLDAVEEAKRKAQPWECQVTVIGPDGEATHAVSGSAQVASSAQIPKPARASQSGFSCDEPE